MKKLRFKEIQHLQGGCKFYDHSSDRCYLLQASPDADTREQKCSCKAECTACSIYDAWAKGVEAASDQASYGSVLW